MAIHRPYRDIVKCLCIAGIIATAGVVPSGNANETVGITLEQAVRKVNIAGRQRMLSQRMAKAACLLSQQITPVSAFDQLSQAYQLFGESDQALRTGAPAFDLPAETIPHVLQALDVVAGHWDTYRGLIDTNLDGNGFDPLALQQLDEASLRVLETMNFAVFQTARAYGSLHDDIPILQTVTVDVAGRQRMLIQRAVKEACMMRVAEDPSLYARRLAVSVQVFDLSLTALQYGYDQVGVIPAPSPHIATQLQTVRDHWGPIKLILDRGAAGEVLNESELEQLARDSEPLLWAMDTAVGLYEAPTP